jgi:hypothetical protein
VIVTQESVAGECHRGKMNDPGDGLSSQLITIGREDQMIMKAQADTRQKLASQ